MPESGRLSRSRRAAPKSLAARLGLKRPVATLKDCMVRHQEVSEDDSLFSAIAVIAANGCVLVRGRSKKIIGLVTTTDLAHTFGGLGEPFLLLGEIETFLRTVLTRLSKDDLQSARAPGDDQRAVENVANLSFGEYVRLIENPAIWSRLELPIDRGTFVKELEAVRIIRNDVMHFDPEGLEPEDLETLRRVSRFMQHMRELGIGALDEAISSV